MMAELGAKAPFLLERSNEPDWGPKNSAWQTAWWVPELGGKFTRCRAVVDACSFMNFISEDGGIWHHLLENELKYLDPGMKIQLHMGGTMEGVS